MSLSVDVPNDEFIQDQLRELDDIVVWYKGDNNASSLSATVDETIDTTMDEGSPLPSNHASPAGDMNEQPPTYHEDLLVVDQNIITPIKYTPFEKHLFDTPEGEELQEQDEFVGISPDNSTDLPVTLFGESSFTENNDNKDNNEERVTIPPPRTESEDSCETATSAIERIANIMTIEKLSELARSLNADVEAQVAIVAQMNTDEMDKAVDACANEVWVDDICGAGVAGAGTLPTTKHGEQGQIDASDTKADCDDTSELEYTSDDTFGARDITSSHLASERSVDGEKKKLTFQGNCSTPYEALGSSDDDVMNRISLPWGDQDGRQLHTPTGSFSVPSQRYSPAVTVRTSNSRRKFGEEEANQCFQVPRYYSDDYVPPSGMSEAPSISSSDVENGNSAHHQVWPSNGQFFSPVEITPPTTPSERLHSTPESISVRVSSASSYDTSYNGSADESEGLYSGSFRPVQPSSLLDQLCSSKKAVSYPGEHPNEVESVFFNRPDTDSHSDVSSLEKVDARREFSLPPNMGSEGEEPEEIYFNSTSEKHESDGCSPQTEPAAVATFSHEGGEQIISLKSVEKRKLFLKGVHHRNCLSCILLTWIVVLIIVILILSIGFGTGMFLPSQDTTSRASERGGLFGNETLAPTQIQTRSATDTPSATPSFQQGLLPTEIPSAHLSDLSSALPTTDLTNASSFSPPAAPTVFIMWEQLLIQAVLSKSWADADVFDDAESPEAKALDWVVQTDQSGLDENDASDLNRIIQRYALLTVWFSSPEAEWGNQDTWLSDDECAWIGVLCNEDGVVVEVDLENNNLQGSLPPDLGLLTQARMLNFNRNQIVGELPSSLGILSDLQILAISDCELSGQLDTFDFSGLAGLEVLDLSSNGLEGSLPRSLYTLDRLAYLNLKNNELSGTLSPDIARLTSLRLLNLIRTNIRGSLPSEIGTMAGLETLDLTSTNFQGTIPTEVGNLSALRYLSLVGSGLTGTIPTEFGLLQNLVTLLMSFVELEGTLPIEIGAMSNLNNFLVEGCGLIGSIPETFGSLTAMQNFNLANNNFEAHPFPTFIFDMKDLDRLELQGSGLTGSLPGEIGRLKKLRNLHLDNNKVEGAIPTEIGDLEALVSLRLEVNSFTGELPNALGQLGQLRDLKLHFNSFNGTLPDSIGDLKNLQFLEVGHNFFSGQIPDSIAGLTKLQNLYCEENYLSGTLPQNLGDLESLIEFVCDSNRHDDLERPGVAGTIPESIGNLQNLESFVFFQNGLTGEIPTSVGGMESLRRFDVEGNLLNSTVPSELANASNLTVLRLGGNEFADPLPDGICELDLMTFMVDCALSCPCCTNCGARTPFL